jgi:hypothetical protein
LNIHIDNVLIVRRSELILRKVSQVALLLDFSTHLFQDVPFAVASLAGLQGTVVYGVEGDLFQLDLRIVSEVVCLYLLLLKFRQYFFGLFLSDCLIFSFCFTFIYRTHKIISLISWWNNDLMLPISEDMVISIERLFLFLVGLHPAIDFAVDQSFLVGGGIVEEHFFYRILSCVHL